MEMQAPNMNSAEMGMAAPADPANILRVANALAGKR